MGVFDYRQRRGVYVWLPVVGASVWCSMLIVMLSVYYAQGGRSYSWQDSRVPYISDIGASSLQPLFIAGSSITAACFVAVLMIERHLYPTEELDPILHRYERVLSYTAILSSAIASFGLILLSCFKDNSFRVEHYCFLGLFIFGVKLSATVITFKYRWLSLKNPDKRLWGAYHMKAAITITLTVLTVVYAVCFWTAPNVAAILEWILAFGFTFYLLSFAYDLRLLVRDSTRVGLDLSGSVEKLGVDENLPGTIPQLH